MTAQTIITFTNGAQLKVEETVVDIIRMMKEFGGATVTFASPVPSVEGAWVNIKDSDVQEFEGLCNVSDE